MKPVAKGAPRRKTATVPGPAAPPTTLANALVADHKRIGAEIRRVARQIESRIPLPQLRESQARLARHVADHFRLEEESIFPFLLFVTGDQARAAVDVLLAEHVEMRASLNAFAVDLAEGNRRAKSFREFRAALALHQARETRLLYPLSDQLLPETVRRQIAERASR